MADACAFGCLGEVMLELSIDPQDQAHLGIAGDTYNTAVYMARRPGLSVSYVTALGSDGFSNRIRAHMATHDIVADRVVTHPTRKPGLYAIETDDAGERSFTYWRSQSAARTLGEDSAPAFSDLLAGLSHLYFSGISLAILSPLGRDRLFAALAAFRGAGGRVAFDSNYRPHLWESPDVARSQTERAWRNCDIGLPSIDDEMTLFGDADESAVLERLANYGLRQGALKRAAAGPVGLDGTHLANVPSARTVVDTTAAGDSFNAAFLACLVAGGTTAEAMTAGHALAVQVIGQRGAIVAERED